MSQLRGGLAQKHAWNLDRSWKLSTGYWQAGRQSLQLNVNTRAADEEGTHARDADAEQRGGLAQKHAWNFDSGWKLSTGHWQAGPVTTGRPQNSGRR